MPSKTPRRRKAKAPTKRPKPPRTTPLGGRPSELDRAAPIVLRELKASATLSMAAAAAGISADTLQEWIQRGNGTHPTRPSTPEYVRFALSLEAAVAEGKRKRIRIITKSKDWRAHAWMLERGHAAEFGRIDRLKAEVGLGGDPKAPPIRTANIPTPELEGLLATLERYQTTGPESPTDAPPSAGETDDTDPDRVP